MITFLIVLLHIFIIVMMATFVIMCTLAATGSFDNWGKRYLKPKNRPAFSEK